MKIIEITVFGGYIIRFMLYKNCLTLKIIRNFDKKKKKKRSILIYFIVSNQYYFKFQFTYPLAVSCVFFFFNSTCHLHSTYYTSEASIEQ